MNRYTVQLLLPDFVADTYGIDTYTAHVVAHDPCRAVRVAISAVGISRVRALESRGWKFIAE